MGDCGIGRAKTAEPIERPFTIVMGWAQRIARAQWYHLTNAVE